jgi:sporulation protein YlmC with PRC-barrel domain
MADDRTIRVNDRATNDTGGALVHSKDLKDFKIPDGDPDPRGWDVKASDGQKLGKVEDLVIDTGTGRIRYLEVAVDKDLKKDGGRDYVLIPVGAGRLNADSDDVIVDLSTTDIAGFPAYDRERFSRDYEDSLRTYVGSRPRDKAADVAAGTAAGAAAADRNIDYYAGPEYDDRSFFGPRRTANRAGNAAENAWDKTKAGAERVGEKIERGFDNVKDRVDGNPASKPGPDPTDRRV